MPLGADVVLDDGTNAVPFQIYEGQGGRPQPKQVATVWTPSGPGTQEAVMFDWKNGFGYSQPGIVTDGYAYGLYIDTRSPGTVVPSGAITEVDTSSLGITLGYVAQNNSFTDPLGNFWILAGRYALKFTGGYGTPGLGQDIGSGRQFFGAVSAAYAGTPTVWIGDDGGFSKFDGATWTRTTSFTRTLMATVYWATTNGVSVQRLVSADTSFTVKHCPMTADPMTSGNWSAAITPGDGSWPINSLPASGRHVYIGTIGGIYDLDDLEQTVNIAPYQTEQLNEYNNVAAITHDGFLLCGAGVGADAVDIRNPGIKQEEAQWVMPGATVGIPNETPIYGRPTAFAKDAGWVVMSVFNGRDSYILYGKRRERLGFPGPGDWIWHGAFAKFTDQLITHMRVRMVDIAGVKSRRLWICTLPYTGATTPARIFYQSLPLTTTPRQDAENSTAHRFSTTASIYMTPQTWNAPGLDKTVIRASFDTRDLGSGNSMSLYLSSDEAAYGSVLAAITESPSVNVPLASSAVTGQQIAPRIDMVGTATVPPVLKSLTLRAIVDPDPVPMFSFDVWLQRDNRLSHGGVQHHSQPEIDYQLLCSMQSQIITFTNVDDTQYTVMLEVLGEPSVLTQFERQSSPGGSATRGWGRRVPVRLRVLDEPALYGQALYNLVARYS